MIPKMLQPEVEAAFEEIKRRLPNTFIALFVFQNVENEEGEAGLLSLVKANAEDPSFMFQVIQGMLETFLARDVPIHDLRDVQGGMQ